MLTKFLIMLNNLFGICFQKLMINDNLNTAEKLQMALIVAEVSLSTLPKDTPYQKFELRWT